MSGPREEALHARPPGAATPSPPGETGAANPTPETTATAADAAPAPDGGAVAVVAFDGDDTLWHHEPVRAVTQERFRALITGHVPYADIDGRLHATETRNLALFGHGVRGFTLAMLESAIELTDGAIPADDLAEIIDWGKRMAHEPVALVDGAREALEALAGRATLILVAKGDLLDQESRLARSGLAGFFDLVEIVSDKTEATYRHLLQRHRIAPERFLMVGDSLRTDVWPVVRAGARAVHVPYGDAGAGAGDAAAALPAGAWRLTNLAELPGLLETFDE